LLYLSDSDLLPEDLNLLGRVLEGRYGKLKLIHWDPLPRALVVKTTTSTAAAIREGSPQLEVRGKRLIATLTSGAIGNLKRRARTGKVG
jgi:hypothetical protein